MSIVRNGQLIGAAGAVTAVPLGELVAVRIPIDLIRDAEGVFQRVDPHFELFNFREWPVEVKVGEDRRVRYGFRGRLGRYEVLVQHGVYPGADTPWT